MSGTNPFADRLRPGALYWSQAGMINCGEHAPPPGSDTWLNQGWLAVGEDDAAEWLSYTGERMACEVCGKRAG